MQQQIIHLNLIVRILDFLRITAEMYSKIYKNKKKQVKIIFFNY